METPYTAGKHFSTDAPIFFSVLAEGLAKLDSMAAGDRVAGQAVVKGLADALADAVDDGNLSSAELFQATLDPVWSAARRSRLWRDLTVAGVESVGEKKKEGSVALLEATWQDQVLVALRTALRAAEDSLDLCLREEEELKLDELLDTLFTTDSSQKLKTDEGLPWKIEAQGQAIAELVLLEQVDISAIEIDFDDHRTTPSFSLDLVTQSSVADGRKKYKTRTIDSSNTEAGAKLAVNEPAVTRVRVVCQAEEPFVLKQIRAWGIRPPAASLPEPTPRLRLMADDVCTTEALSALAGIDEGVLVSKFGATELVLMLRALVEGLRRSQGPEAAARIGATVDLIRPVAPEIAAWADLHVASHRKWVAETGVCAVVSPELWDALLLSLCADLEESLGLQEELLFERSSAVRATSANGPTALVRQSVPEVLLNKDEMVIMNPDSTSYQRTPIEDVSWEEFVPEEFDDATNVHVWYATERTWSEGDTHLPTGPAPLSPKNDDYDNFIVLLLKVQVPKYPYDRGLESPKIIESAVVTEEGFQRFLGTHSLKRSQSSEGPLLQMDPTLLVHGFSTPPESAAIQGAKVLVDVLQKGGPVVMWSWRCGGNMADFFADHIYATTQGGGFLTAFLRLIMTSAAPKSTQPSFNILAHSMGTALATAALNGLNLKTVPNPARGLGRVIVTAAITLPGWFPASITATRSYLETCGLDPNIRAVSYCHRSDAVLVGFKTLSRGIWETKFEGQCIPLSNDVEVVDVTEVVTVHKDDLARHSFHQTSAPAREDMFEVLRGKGFETKQRVSEWAGEIRYFALTAPRTTI